MSSNDVEDRLVISAFSTIIVIIITAFCFGFGYSSLNNGRNTGTVGTILSFKKAAFEIDRCFANVSFVDSNTSLYHFRGYVCAGKMPVLFMDKRYRMTTSVQDPNYVISQVIEMQNVVRHGNKRILKDDFAEFKEKCPALYEKSSRPMDSTEMEVLLTMLRRVQDIRENKISQHDGSVQVGQLLVNKYISPVVEGNTQQTT